LFLVWKQNPAVPLRSFLAALYPAWAFPTLLLVRCLQIGATRN
jgi:hypothetical protein